MLRMPAEVLPRTYRNSQVFSPLSFFLINFCSKAPGARISAERTHWRRRSKTLTLSSGDLAL